MRKFIYSFYQCTVNRELLFGLSKIVQLKSGEWNLCDLAAGWAASRSRTRHRTAWSGRRNALCLSMRRTTLSTQPGTQRASSSSSPSSLDSESIELSVVQFELSSPSSLANNRQLSRGHREYRALLVLAYYR
jgi:hypothetical protein